MQRPSNEYMLTPYARWRMGLRDIDPAAVDVVLRMPEQVLVGHRGREVFQSRIRDETTGRMYLLRVVVDREQTPPEVVTVLRNKQDREVLGGPTMKVVYDSGSDTMSILLKEAKIADSDEISTGVIVDYDGDGNVVGLEILDASERVDITRFQFEPMGGHAAAHR